MTKSSHHIQQQHQLQRTLPTAQAPSALLAAAVCLLSTANALNFQTSLQINSPLTVPFDQSLRPFNEVRHGELAGSQTAGRTGAVLRRTRRLMRTKASTPQAARRPRCAASEVLARCKEARSPSSSQVHLSPGDANEMYVHWATGTYKTGNGSLPAPALIPSVVMVGMQLLLLSAAQPQR